MNDAFQVVPLGQLGFPSITGSQVNGALYDFEVDSDNSTSWRWEFWRSGAMQDSYDWDDPESGQQIQYVFPQSGSWEVRVYSRNCETMTGDEAGPGTLQVEVTAEPANLEIDYFKPLTCGANTCFLGFDCSCSLGSTVVYEIGLTGTSEVPDNFEFDWTGEDPFSVEQTRPAGTPVTPGVYRFNRIYTETGTHRAQTRAEKNGSTSAVEDAFARIIIQ